MRHLTSTRSGAVQRGLSLQLAENKETCESVFLAKKYLILVTVKIMIGLISVHLLSLSIRERLKLLLEDVRVVLVTLDQELHVLDLDLSGKLDKLGEESQAVQKAPILARLLCCDLNWCLLLRVRPNCGVNPVEDI